MDYILAMIAQRNNTYGLYSGNDRFNLVSVGLYESEILIDETEDIEFLITFGSVTFSNGSATRSWSSGSFYDGN